jgi:hypothetical protein
MLCIRAGRECQTTATVRRIAQLFGANARQLLKYPQEPGEYSRAEARLEWDAAIHEAARDGAAGDTR